MKCARQVARDIRTAGGTDHDAALAVHEHCGVSLLRAHRIARGFTLVEAVDALKEILAVRGTPAERLGHQRLSQWEQGQDFPSPHYLDALCFLYRTRPDRLGFGHDYSDADSLPQNGFEDDMDRRHFVGLAAAGAMFLPAAPNARLFGDAFDPPGGRRAAAAYVGLLEDLTEQSGYRLHSSSPAEFIPARMVDLARAQAGLLTVTSDDIRRRLHRVFAKNAGFIAIRLNDVAATGDTFEWFGIARRAARSAEDPAVQAWIAGWTCDACACHNQLESGLAAAKAARTVGARRADSATVMGYLTEAGVLARLGRRRETIEAVRRADALFAELPDTQVVADGFHISEYLLRWYQANSLALVGAHAEAAPLRARALELPLAQDDLVGNALLHLDEAAAQIDAGELELACHTITATWQRLPREFRVGQVPARIHELIDPLGSGKRTARAVAEVRSMLESSSSSR